MSEWNELISVVALQRGCKASEEVSKPSQTNPKDKVQAELLKKSGKGPAGVSQNGAIIDQMTVATRFNWGLWGYLCHPALAPGPQTQVAEWRSGINQSDSDWDAEEGHCGQRVKTSLSVLKLSQQIKKHLLREDAWLQQCVHFFFFKG